MSPATLREHVAHAPQSPARPDACTRRPQQNVECEFTIATSAATLGELFATVPVLREARA